VKAEEEAEQKEDPLQEGEEKPRKSVALSK